MRQTKERWRADGRRRPNCEALCLLPDLCDWWWGVGWCGAVCGGVGKGLLAWVAGVVAVLSECQGHARAESVTVTVVGYGNIRIL